jgi:hypothetical protein
VFLHDYPFSLVSFGYVCVSLKSTIGRLFPPILFVFHAFRKAKTPKKSVRPVAHFLHDVTLSSFLLFFAFRFPISIRLVSYETLLSSCRKVLPRDSLRWSSGVRCHDNYDCFSLRFRLCFAVAFSILPLWPVRSFLIFSGFGHLIWRLLLIDCVVFLDACQVGTFGFLLTHAPLESRGVNTLSFFVRLPLICFFFLFFLILICSGRQILFYFSWCDQSTLLQLRVCGGALSVVTLPLFVRFTFDDLFHFACLFIPPDPQTIGEAFEKWYSPYAPCFTFTLLSCLIPLPVIITPSCVASFFIFSHCSFPECKLDSFTTFLSPFTRNMGQRHFELPLQKKHRDPIWYILLSIIPSQVTPVYVKPLSHFFFYLSTFFSSRKGVFSLIFELISRSHWLWWNL